MKTKVLAMASAALLAVTGVAATATFSGAVAQQTQRAPVILIINHAQVLAQSKVGQSMGPQLEKLQETANTELNAEVEKLTKEGEDLKKQRDLMAEDVWMERARQLAIKQNNLPTLREVKLRELSIAEQQALAHVNEKLNPILQKIVQDRGATILLDRSAVLYASADSDITSQVISELDKVMTSVKVEKVSLAELQRQAEQAAKQQQSGNRRR
jgi:outer membrane protein